MKLKSAIVRNYRVHKETVVDFESERILFQGPNESGKSTFVEAVHRCLFLKARITGETREGMLSNKYAGNPEITVNFETGGREYRLTKVFSGQSGSIHLSESGGQSWYGEEAEARLSCLLGNLAQCGGRGVASELSRTWAHLWVWQGRSGENPAEEVNRERERILHNLQNIGGAAVVQSQLDTELAGDFKNRFELIFTKNEKPKSGSELDNAGKEYAEAEKNLILATEKFNELIQAARDYQAAENDILECGRSLKTLKDELDANVKQLEEAQKVEASIQGHTEKLQNEKNLLKGLEETEKSIEFFRINIKNLSLELEPGKNKLAAAQDHLRKMKQKYINAEKDENKAIQSAEGLRSRLELTRTWAEYFRHKDELEKLKESAAKKDKHDFEIRHLEQEIARLPAITDADLKSINNTEASLNTTKAVLESMAAEITVVQAEQQVIIDGEAAPANTTRTATDSLEVKIGSDVLLRVQPGGGTSLIECRNRLRDLQDKLNELLVKHGLSSTAEAKNAVDKRKALRQNIDSLQKQMEAFDDGTLNKRLNAALNKMTGIEEDLNRRRKDIENAFPPQNREEAEELFKLETGNEEDVREALNNVRETKQSILASFDDAAREVETLKNETEAISRKIADQESRLSEVLAQCGEDDLRQQKLLNARDFISGLEKELNEFKYKLEQMRPDFLKKEKERIQRAMDIQKNKLESAREKKISSQTRLTSSGSSDPQADLENAKARVQTAQERLRNVNTKAQAVKLLHNLFQNEQKKLMDVLTKPLEDKITAYLRAVFGPDARAAVNYEDNTFKGFELVRPGMQTVSFDSLSGGTREQVAAASRLAIAEILAADHGGCLPVVFDDAFVNSDPDRVRSLQSMLDQAASKGLQVIVLTCNPYGYAGLGASCVEFARKD